MIERIVLLKLAGDHASDASLAEIAAHSQRILAALPGVRECRVGRAADGRTAGEWHLSLVLRFSSIDDVAPYAAHPDHRAYVDDYLRPKLAAIAAFNFEI
jgi:hypothetical protein